MRPNLLKSLLFALLLFQVGVIIAFSFPLNYIAWGIYNRQKVRIWQSSLLVLISLLIVLLYSSLLLQSSAAITIKYILGMSTFITVPFIATRIIPAEVLTERRRYYLAVGFVFIQVLMLLSPALVIHGYLYLYKRSSLDHLSILLITLETATFVWISLVSFFFIKYPNDELVTLLKRFGPYIQKR